MSASRIIVYLLLGTTVFMPKSLAAGDQFSDIFTGAKPHLELRYRFEHVDDNALQANGATLDQANASTFRTLVGFETGSFQGFSGTLDIENVAHLGGDDFNDGSNGKTGFATVVDPDGTELEQAFIQFTGIEDTVLKGGRQYITYRKAPFHRYIGTILWRQNWQNFDAVSISNNSLPDTTISYAYVWNVNRIFGDDAPEPLSEFEGNSHFINLKYDGFKTGKLEAYSYLLDFDNAAAFSTQTYGLRFNGTRSLNENTGILYTAEYARQYDFGDNTADVDAYYFLAEGGLKYKTKNTWVSTVTAKLSYELLSGDGGADRFVTILGTNHAFQGWADKLLITPGDGIQDIYGSIIMNIYGAKFVAVYHDFSSDRDDYDYGSEIDLLLTKKFAKKFIAGLKYAHYEGDDNATNAVRNPALTQDKTIFWAFLQYKY